MADPASYRPAPGSIPESPGVYRFRDERGRVIYVGKAKNLRSRLNSYFADFAGMHPRTQTMVRSAAAVDWTVVGTEVEALQLEYSWIKEFDPRFNVRYRDDKSYPYLAVTMDEEYPRVMVMRGAQAARGAVLRPVLARLGDQGDGGHAAAGVPGPDLLGRGVQAGGPDRPALPARLHRQVLGAVRRPGQRRRAPVPGRGVLRLHGRADGQVHRRLEAEMRRAADAEEYERAARLRDDIQALHRALEKQAVVLGDGTDCDVIALAEDQLEAAVQVFYVRGGRVRGQRGWVVDKVEDITPGELVEQFLGQVYGDDPVRASAGVSAPGGSGTGRRGGPAAGERRAAARRAGAARGAGAGLPPARRRSRNGSPPGAAAGSASGSRSGGTRRRCSTPWRGTRRSRWRCTRPGAPAT